MSENVFHLEITRNILGFFYNLFIVLINLINFICYLIVFVKKISVGGRKVKGRYLPEQDKVIFWDEANIGLRGDYNGVLL